MNLKNRRWLLPISVMALLGIILIVWHSLFQDFGSYPVTNHGICPRMVPNYLLWLSLILMVVGVVPISYYFISKRLEEKMEKNISAITKLVDRGIKTSAKGEKIRRKDNGNILKLLNPNEKKVVERIIENKGSVLQSEISRMDGMTKLKAHRTLNGLKRKGVVKLEPYGKTNRITLSKDIQEIVSKF